MAAGVIVALVALPLPPAGPGSGSEARERAGVTASVARVTVPMLARGGSAACDAQAQVVSVQAGGVPEIVRIEGGGRLGGWSLVSASGYLSFTFPAGFVLDESVEVWSATQAFAPTASRLWWTQAFRWDDLGNLHAMLYDCLGVLRSSFATGCVPSLSLPAEGAILDNGRADFDDLVTWDFSWTACPGASAYQIVVFGPLSTTPEVDESALVTTGFRYEWVGWVGVRQGWTWRVRAEVDGQWQPWSEQRTFDVEPVDSDPPAGCAPACLP